MKGGKKGGVDLEFWSPTRDFHHGGWQRGGRLFRKIQFEDVHPLRVDGGDRGEKALGVGMIGVCCDRLSGTFFDQFAVFENGNLIADVFDHGEVMRDEEVSEIEFFLQIHQKVDDLGLHRDIQGTDRFVANDEFRFDGQGAGDSDPLALPPTELVREAASMCGVKADESEEFGHPCFPFGRGHF